MITRREGQSWEQAYREDRGFWRLTKAERSRLLAWAKKEDRRSAQQLLGALSTPETTTLPPETDFFIPDGMTPEQATREKIKRDAEMYPIETVPDLRGLPVHELARLEKWMVPPSRRQELREYRDALRRKAIADRDAKAAAMQAPMPGERWPDPRGYWSKNQQGSRHLGDQISNHPGNIDSANQDCPERASGIYEVKSGEPFESKDPQALNQYQAQQLQPTLSINDKRSLLQRGTGENALDFANRVNGINDVSLMNASELQEILLSEEFPELPSRIREAMTDRFLALEGFPVERESFWQQLEKEGP